MRLTVNFGDHSRTILAASKKERGNPREIEGRQAFLCESRTAQNAGEISEGMLFDIGYADGSRRFSLFRTAGTERHARRIRISLARRAGNRRAGRRRSLRLSTDCARQSKS